MPSLFSLGTLSTRLLFVVLGMLLLSPSAMAQGSGRSSTGTGGNHVIQGYVFFPSGRKAEGTIVVKLTSLPSTSRRYTVMVHLQLKPNAGIGKPGVVNAALASVPEKARKLYERGVEQSRADDAAKAADSLKQAVTVYPNFPLALNELGVQYLKLQQINKAVDVLREACKLNPEAFPSRLNFGIALLEAKQFAPAEEQLREASKRNNNSATAHMYLGIALLRQSKFDESEKELLTATQANATQLGMANYYLGGLYWRKKDYPRAVEQLEKYLASTPNAPDADRVRATIKEFRSRITPE
jgi:Tfp pilus assembly protein PilF